MSTVKVDKVEGYIQQAPSIDYVKTNGTIGNLGTDFAAQSTALTNAVVSTSLSVTDGHAVVFNGTTGKSVKTAGAAPVLSTALDTDAQLTANSDVKLATQKAVKSYVDASVVGLWDDRGSYNASVNTFPASGGSGTAGAVKKGDIWTVSVAGTLGGVAVSIGDTVRALIDTPGQTSSNWAILEGNLGYTPLNKDSNLSDLANAGTARTNLGLGTLATLSSVGTAQITDANVTYAKLQNITSTARVLGRKTAGAGVTEELSLSELLDFIGSAARGDILVRGASTWSKLSPGASGTYIKSNGAGADLSYDTPPGATPSASVVRTTDLAKTSDATVAADPVLQFSMSANKLYRISLIVAANTASGDATMKFSLFNTGTTTSAYGSYQAGRGSNNVSFGAFSAMPADVNAGFNTLTGDCFLKINLVIQNGGTDSTFQFGWAQNTSHADATTVKAGSILDWIEA